MPEGPSIIILKEEVQPFKGRKVLAVAGNSKVDIQRCAGHKVIDFKSFGKQFLICFKTFTVRIHLMMFGSYRINEEKNTAPRLSLKFSNGQLNFYACSVKIIEENLDDVYDWPADVMSDAWDPDAALQKLAAAPGMLVCDALLDQQIFAGVGNIIKNEVLFRVRISPLSEVGAIPEGLLKTMADEARIYCFQFLEWKKAFELKNIGWRILRRFVRATMYLFYMPILAKTTAALSIAVSARCYIRRKHCLLNSWSFAGN